MILEPQSLAVYTIKTEEDSQFGVLNKRIEEITLAPVNLFDFLKSDILYPQDSIVSKVVSNKYNSAFYAEQVGTSSGLLLADIEDVNIENNDIEYSRLFRFVNSEQSNLDRCIIIDSEKDLDLMVEILWEKLGVESNPHKLNRVLSGIAYSEFPEISGPFSQLKALFKEMLPTEKVSNTSMAATLMNTLADEYKNTGKSRLKFNLQNKIRGIAIVANIRDIGVITKKQLEGAFDIITSQEVSILYPKIFKCPAVSSMPFFSREINVVNESMLNTSNILRRAGTGLDCIVKFFETDDKADDILCVFSYGSTAGNAYRSRIDQIENIIQRHGITKITCSGEGYNKTISARLNRKQFTALFDKKTLLLNTLDIVFDSVPIVTKDFKSPIVDVGFTFNLPRHLPNLLSVNSGYRSEISEILQVAIMSRSKKEQKIDALKERLKEIYVDFEPRIYSFFDSIFKKGISLFTTTGLSPLSIIYLSNIQNSVFVVAPTGRKMDQDYFQYSGKSIKEYITNCCYVSSAKGYWFNLTNQEGVPGEKITRNIFHPLVKTFEEECGYLDLSTVEHREKTEFVQKIFSYILLTYIYLRIRSGSSFNWWESPEKSHLTLDTVIEHMVTANTYCVAQDAPGYGSGIIGFKVPYFGLKA